jgi:hypothetical protein
VRRPRPTAATNGNAHSAMLVTAIAAAVGAGIPSARANHSGSYQDAGTSPWCATQRDVTTSSGMYR